MKTRTSKQFFVIGLVTLLGILAFSTHTVSAYTNNTSPDPNHTTNAYGDQLGHLVASATYINVPTTKLVIYSTSPKIGVAIASADMCNDTVDVSGMRDNVGPLMGGVTGAATKYSVSGDVAASNHYGTRNRACTSGKNVMAAGDPENVTLNASSQLIIARSTGAPVDTSQGFMYRYDFVAEFRGCVTLGTESCGVNYFSVKAMGITGGVYNASAKMVISQAAGSGKSGANGIGGFGSTFRTSGAILDAFFDYDVEFGSECDATQTSAQIEIFDDDNVNGPGAQWPAYPFGLRLERSPKGTTSWTTVPGAAAGFTYVSEATTPQRPVAGSGATPGNIGRNELVNGWLQVGTNGSQKTMNLEFNLTPDYQYRLRVHQIDPHNNLQFSYPFEAINQYINCGGNTGPNPYITRVQPILTGGLNDNGDVATFTQSARVYDFPGPKHWGYNEIARPNAWNVGRVPFQITYASSDEGNGGPVGSATLQAQCGGGAWKDAPVPASGAGSCGSNQFLCQDGNARVNCGNFHYRCVATGNNPTPAPGDFYDGSNPRNGGGLPGTCNFFKHNCDTYSFRDYRRNPVDQCTDRYRCSLRDGTWVPGVHRSTAENCKIFTCAYVNDGQHDFYDDDGDVDAHCEYRCKDGAGDRAWFMQDQTHDEAKAGVGDRKCYIPPTFYIICTWDAGGGSTSVQAVTYATRNNAYCVGDARTTITRTVPDAQGRICADTTPSGPGGAAFYWNNDAGSPTDINATVVPPGKSTATGNGNGSFSDYRENWTFSVGDVEPVCVLVGARPYFSVLGGDITAGPGFGTGCVNNNADIIGSTRFDAPYAGAGAQLAAIALSSIKSFATSHTQLGGTWVDSLSGGQSAASNLAFSNSVENVNTAGGIYGGNFGTNGASSWCVPDYYSAVTDYDRTTNANTINADTVDGGGGLGTTYTVYVTGDVTLNTGTIPSRGQKVILKVNGNVYINGPSGGPNQAIQYVNPASLADIPQFQVLARGNIYVAPNVGRLDGFYDAQGSDLRGGVFASCGRASGPITGSTTVAECRTQNLTVNGTVAAGVMMLNRTLGDRSGRFSQPQAPAETFVFSPQFWVPSAFKRTGIGPWQSVTSLPPIL